MANTYSQLYVHIIFAVKGRQSLLLDRTKYPELQKYITGIVKNIGQKLIAINNEPDHLHMLLSYKPSAAISDMVRDIKSNSARFIKSELSLTGKFEWQEGFGAFSHSKSQVDAVVKYILNQQVHHHKETFREEYVALLKNFEIEFKDEYLFEFIERDW